MRVILCAAPLATSFADSIRCGEAVAKWGGSSCIQTRRSSSSWQPRQRASSVDAAAIIDSWQHHDNLPDAVAWLGEADPKSVNPTSVKHVVRMAVCSALVLLGIALSVATATRWHARGETKATTQIQTALTQLVFPPAAELTQNILAGFVMGIKLTLGMVVFANIVFNSIDNERLNSQFATGVNINLLSAIIGVLMSTGLSGMNIFTAPPDIPAMVLGDLAEVLAKRVQDEKKLAHTLMACMFISALFAGCVALALGLTHMGRMFQKIPVPVVGGFIAATGACAICSALSMLTGVSFEVWARDSSTLGEFRTWMHLGLGILTVLSIRCLSGYLKPLIRHASFKSLVQPLCLLFPLFFFYFVVLCRWNIEADFVHLRSIKWVYPTRDSRPFYSVWQETLSLGHVEWWVLADSEVIEVLVVLQFLSLFSAMLALAGLATALPGGDNVDKDRELIVLGASNLVIGAVGGNLAYQHLGGSINTYKDGATHRLAQLVAVSVVASVFFSGIPITPYIPKFFLAGVFLNVGFDFLKTYLLDQYGKMDRASYGCMLVVVMVALLQNLHTAVAIGVVLQVIIMLVLSSTVSPVCLKGDTSTMSSSRMRLPEDRRMISQSRLLQVVCLQGPLFFGLVSNAADDVLDLINNVEPKPLHLILDLSRVSLIDHSAVSRFVTIVAVATESHVRIVFTGASDLMWKLEQQNLVAKQQPLEADVEPKAEWYETLDEALDVCEQRILSNLRGQESLAVHIPHWESTGAMSEEEALNQSGMSTEQWNELLLVCDVLVLEVDDVIVQPNEGVDAIHLLVRGCLELTLPGDMRGQAMRVAPIAVLGGKQVFAGFVPRLTARVISKAGAKVLRFPEKKLQDMKKHKKEVYIAFMENIIIRGLCCEQTVMVY